jgi:type IV pilus assembly protein PilN
MIRINLLPHREEKRKQDKKAFYSLLVLFAIVGGVIVLVVGGIFATRISIQNDRNRIIEAENKLLDKKIEEIASLKQDIEGLKARQQAVEDLQGDRNQPVYLMDELVKQTPEGVYLRAFKQDGQRIVMNGYAQSNERVSDLLRNFSNNSPWLEQPQLVEIRSTSLGTGKGAKMVFDFTVNVGIKRPRDKDKPPPGVAGAAGKPGTPAKAGKPE